MNKLKAAFVGLTTLAGITANAWEFDLGKNHKIDFHGFASQGFLKSTDYQYLGNSESGSFEFSEFALNASMSPFARTRISAQAFAFDVGNVGRYEPGLDYALIDYSFSDAIGIRAGRIRRPDGIYNSIQDIDLSRTSILLPQGLYDARYRDFSASVDGGSIYGSIGLGKAGGLSYEIYGGYVNLSEKGGVARLLQDSIPRPPFVSYTKVNGFPKAGAQLWWNTPVNGLRAGAALSQAFGFSYDYYIDPFLGTLGVNPTGHIHSELDSPAQQYSLEYQVKNWTFQAEYKTENYVTQNSAGGVVFQRTRSRAEAWYVGAAYRFNSWAEVGTYYTEHYADASDRDGSKKAVQSDGFQKDLALSLRFDPKPWWIFKLEGHYIRGTSLLHANQDNPVRNDDGWFLFAAKTTFSF